VVRELLTQLQDRLLLEVVVVVAVQKALAIVALEVLVAEVMVRGLLALLPVPLELLILAVVAAVEMAEILAMDLQAVLALSSLECLTILAQCFLVALQEACPHPVGSTSTL
jgi:hypothetical protein